MGVPLVDGSYREEAIDIAKALIVKHWAMAQGHSSDNGLVVLGISMRRNNKRDVSNEELLEWAKSLKAGIRLCHTLPPEHPSVAAGRAIAEGVLGRSFTDIEFSRREYYEKRERHWYHPCNQYIQEIQESQLPL